MRVGHATKDTPQNALKEVAKKRGLNGDYDVVADSSLTRLPVETETTTVAKVGKPRSG